MCLTRLFRKLVKSRPSALGLELDVEAHGFLLGVWTTGVKASGPGKYEPAEIAGSITLLRGMVSPKVSNAGGWGTPTCEQSNAAFPDDASVLYQRIAKHCFMKDLPSHWRTLSGLVVNEP